MPRRRTIVKVYPQYDDEPAFVEHQPRSERPVLSRRGTGVTLNESDPEPWVLNQPSKYGVPKNGDPWESCYEKMRGYDDDICDGWKSEIDNLLIFAGLFSSVVTAFLIESYTALSQDPNDVNAFYLQQILLELRNANLQNTPAFNAPIPEPPAFAPSPRDIRINVFWFMSLSLSVAVVIIGILCTQWIREYERETSSDPQDAIALRHIRHEGLVRWKVPNILRALPVMLHSSLILFFVGLVDLLWSLNHIVALFVSAISGIVLFVLAGTTVLPALQLYAVRDRYLRVPQCAYKSAQSWVVYRVISFCVWLLAPPETLHKDRHYASLRERYNDFSAQGGWDEFDAKWRKVRGTAYKKLGHVGEGISNDLVEGLVWIDKHLGQSIDAIHSIYHCLKEFKFLDQTKQALLRMNAKIATYLGAPEMSIYLASLSDEEQREILSVLFLEINGRAFPQLDQYQVESVVRILNKRLARIQRKESGDTTWLWPFIRWPFDNIFTMPDELITQVLLCTKELVTFQLADKYEKEVWDLMRGVILAVRGEEMSPERVLHKRLALDSIQTSATSAADLPQVALWIDRVVNMVLPERSRLGSLSLYPLVEALVRRVQAVASDPQNPFASPRDRMNWDILKKNYADMKTVLESSESSSPTSI